MALTIPPWVPDAVCNAARALYADAVKRDDVEFVVVLKRLVTHQQMRPVWRELIKQTRESTTTFLHSAKPTWNFHNVADRQNTAIASLLYLAINLAMDDPTVMTEREVKTAAPAAVETRLVVERDTGDAQARCFAILFADQCRRLFGSPLYGVTATVGSVALQRKLTTRAVRGWVQHN